MNPFIFIQRFFLVLICILTVHAGGVAFGAEFPAQELVSDETSRVVKIIQKNNCNAFSFDATDFADSASSKMKFTWDLGDGTIVNQPVVDHVYRQGGEYTVRLTVKDDAQHQEVFASSAQTIRAGVAPVMVLNAPEKVCLGEEFRLEVQGKDAQEGALKFIWDLGDGTQGAGRYLKKKYEEPGRYTIRLTAVDHSEQFCAQSSIEKELVVMTPPQAHAGDDIDLQCLAQSTDLTLTFNAFATESEDNDSLKYSWNFGDGTSGEGQLVDHQYRKDGRYQVRLTVSDPSGLICGNSTDTLEVNLSRGVEARAGGDVYACVGDNVLFDGSASYGPQGALFSSWDFGDGSSTRGLRLTHRYQKEGIYQATLTVSDPFQPSCEESSDTRLVIVKQPPLVRIESIGDGYAGEEVFFQAMVDYPALDELEYFWSFGDGTLLRGGPITSHQFKKAGYYNVSIVVDQNTEAQCSSSSARMPIDIQPARSADDAAQNDLNE